MSAVSRQVKSKWSIRLKVDMFLDYLTTGKIRRIDSIELKSSGQHGVKHIKRRDNEFVERYTNRHAYPWVTIITT